MVTDISAHRTADAQKPATTLREVLNSGRRSFSFEFFPPKDDEGERRLWQALRELEPLQPTFVSVTYGAGGGTRDRTIGITGQIAQDTTLRPVAHLTCVNHSRAELRSIIGRYIDVGVNNVLALRGDPPGGPNEEWIAHPEGLHHTHELVTMLRELGQFSIGVAAFPEGHPKAESLEADAQYLVRKAEAGADFAATQFFFNADDYFRLVDRVRGLGCEIPIVPGIMPVTNLRQIRRMSELQGSDLPTAVTERLQAVEDDPAAMRAAGIEVASELASRLLAGGAPGLHFYTLNRSTATREIWENLGSQTEQ